MNGALYTSVIIDPFTMTSELGLHQKLAHHLTGRTITGKNEYVVRHVGIQLRRSHKTLDY